MKAILEYNLPEDQHDHAYALSGLDALLVIDDVLTEIRSALKYDSGDLAKFRDDDGKIHSSCAETLELVREFICLQKQNRNLPELI